MYKWEWVSSGKYDVKNFTTAISRIIIRITRITECGGGVNGHGHDMTIIIHYNSLQFNFYVKLEWKSAAGNMENGIRLWNSMHHITHNK